jgi:hypothetical protein
MEVIHVLATSSPQEHLEYPRIGGCLDPRPGLGSVEQTLCICWESNTYYLILQLLGQSVQ